MIKEILKIYLKERTQGFSFKLIEPTSGYMVSFRTCIKDELDLELIDKKDVFIGGWTDESTGIEYLDYSLNVFNLDEALEIGKKHNQIAIFDLENCSDVLIDYDK